MSHGHLVWQNVAKCKICSAVTLINGSIGCCHGQEATVRGCAHVPCATHRLQLCCVCLGDAESKQRALTLTLFMQTWLVSSISYLGLVLSS